jgi:glycosyltransferase involved in cell wall biosynthesis
MVQIMYSYGVNRSYKINVLRNATEFGVLSIKHEDEINKKFKIKNDDFLVVYVGRVVKYKNLNLIIKSANKLSKMTQQFKFLICGDGKHLKWMQDEVKKANMEHLFIFTGKIADRLLIQKIYARADLNIMISLFDTASLSIVEAASQYTPSLCIKNSTVSSDIKHQVNGYLVNNSSLAIAKSINSMMLKKTLHKAISKKAHRDLYIS